MENKTQISLGRKLNFKASMFAKIALVLLLGSSVTYAQSTQNNVSVKCHVSLIDGNEAITLWSIPKNRVKHFKEELVGQTVKIKQNRPGIKVYKAHECALDDALFKSSQARALDKKKAR